MANQTETYRFGEYELDAARWELRRADRLVTLQPQQLRLLLYLVRYRDRLVTKAELLEAVWGGVVVTDYALWTAVRALRRALGDTIGPNAMIRTRRGLGMRFVAPVSVLGSSSVEAARELAG